MAGSIKLELYTEFHGIDYQLDRPGHGRDGHVHNQFTPRGWELLGRYCAKTVGPGARNGYGTESTIHNEVLGPRALR